MRLRTTTEQPDQVEAAAERSRQREGLLEQQRLNEAMRSNKPELERSRLTFRRHGEVTHDDGRQYRLVRGEIVGAPSSRPSMRGTSIRSGARSSCKPTRHDELRRLPQARPGRRLRHHPRPRPRIRRPVPTLRDDIPVPDIGSRSHRSRPRISRSARCSRSNPGPSTTGAGSWGEHGSTHHLPGFDEEHQPASVRGRSRPPS